MSGRGNEIVVSAEPNGRFIEGTIKTGETPSPGSIMQIDTSAGINSLGRFDWELYNVSADGVHPVGPFIILREDIGQGKTNTDAYAAGDHAYGYIPLHGDELNLLIDDVAGTADIGGPRGITTGIAMDTIMVIIAGTTRGAERVMRPGIAAVRTTMLTKTGVPACNRQRGPARAHRLPIGPARAHHHAKTMSWPIAMGCPPS